MKVYRSLEEVPRPQRGCVLTVGNFDGVHLGHQAIIERAKQLATAEKLPLIGMTFDPSPMKVLRPNMAPRILTALAVKEMLLAEQGLDQLVVVKSTPQFLSLSQEEFVQSVLVDRMEVRHMVEGQTFNFGQNRSGTMVSLEDLSKQFDFAAHLVASKTIDLGGGAPTAVNSTLIRQQVARGRMDQARLLLGRDYAMVGRVVKGRGRGRQLGFPTVNLALIDPDQLVPEDAVFAGYAKIAGTLKQAWRQNRLYPAAISIGRAPTFADTGWLIEAHLLNYDRESEGPLYGKHILLSPIELVRPQQRFSDDQALIEAIGEDCKKIEQILRSKGIKTS